ncbi:MAG: hypothetical protein M1823_002983 [Watsoniomyces obsoletus]|nr:MAG: hypothetical protein M1823_002983 [Watsoniomyces obsoletus]
MSQQPLAPGPHNGTANSSDIFVPIATQAPPSNIGVTNDHPVPRQGIVTQDRPIPTNKFYANFFLGRQNQSTWTHPYSVSWSQGSGNAQSWGLSVSHADADQKAFGEGDPARYYINPLGNQSVILSAAELGNTTALSLDNLTEFSANISFLPQPGGAPAITFPVVQGMGFFTGQYRGARPVIQSSIFFRTVNRVPEFDRPGLVKYRILLEDGKTWLLYASSNEGGDINFQMQSNSRMEATAPLNGVIQVAKLPVGSSDESPYDAAAGVYAVGATLSGSTNGNAGSYTLRWTKAGIDTNSRPLLMFALPHHVESFDSPTNGGRTLLQLQTTTKGAATAVLGDAWTMVENNLPVEIGFAPWSPDRTGPLELSPKAVDVINGVAVNETDQDVDAQSDLDSMYFSGKALGKFAQLVYTVNDLAKNPSLAQAGLEKLKGAFARFANNQQKNPLVYETAWKGVVSSAAFTTGDPNADFGNSLYNDHHFHYGYFIFTAAVIGYLDPSWLAANRDWVNMLLRDAANPSDQDPYFPVSRAFDWYHGHSWAKGLFESADGKDEESSSEDAFFAYAVKMWGRTLGDAAIEGRGNLMLAVLARTLRNYFLMESNNRNHPPNFIGNKVTGILFENKVDHTTYFGTNIEYIQGIHMLPINPSSAYTRPKNFVAEEWATFFDQGRVDAIGGGWRGILYANLALIDPAASWRFFSQGDFDLSWIDGGASRTWYLAYAAGTPLVFCTVAEENLGLGGADQA